MDRSLLILAAAPFLLIWSPAGAQDHTSALEPDLAGFEDYRAPVGVMEDSVLRIPLEARPARWQPWGPEGPVIYTHVFAAEGQPARAPAPLVRFAAGTPLHVTVRNTQGEPTVQAIFGYRGAGEVTRIERP
jgi:hypothetical protein